MRGSPAGGSERCGGGGVGTAIWVGLKLLITHDTWQRADKRGKRDKEGRNWFHSTTEMDDFLLHEILQVCMETDSEAREGETEIKERGIGNELSEGEGGMERNLYSQGHTTGTTLIFEVNTDPRSFSGKLIWVKRSKTK